MAMAQFLKQKVGQGISPTYHCSAKQEECLAQAATYQKRRVKTERIAYALYQNRQRQGKAGNAQSDWITAERLIRNPFRKTLFSFNCAVLKVKQNFKETAETKICDF